MIHDNSSLSYTEHKHGGSHDTWRSNVFDFYSKDRVLTDRDVIVGLKATDVNLVRPEITRLIQDGLLIEMGKVKCSITNRTVRTTTPTGEIYFSRGA
jgi:hypothetical protein